MIRFCCVLILGILSIFQTFATAVDWPQDHSDLQADPAVHWGALPNGLRYAIRPNAEPRDRISLRFLVLAGSLHERDDERGLAHFLEHMAFRSSQNHEKGSLIEELQRLGIGFGPDNTAFTTTDYTIYHLELPNTKPETLETALHVFRIYADGLKFKPDDIDRERGVVLSEMATRDTPAARAGNANQAFFYPLSRTIDREPIGTEEQIRTMHAGQFQAFYDAWYRPEKMILTLVGEVDPEVASAAIAEAFGSLEGRGESRPEPGLVNHPDQPNPEPQIAIYRDFNTVGLALTLAHVSPRSLEPDTKATRTQDLYTALAFHMLQKRLANLSTQRGSSYGTPLVYYGSVLQGWQTSSISIPGNLIVWRLLVSAAEQELRRALQYGFTESELRNAKTSFTTSYQQQVRSVATMPSDLIATYLATYLAYNNVFSSAAYIAEEMQPLVDAATLEDCQTAFREVWGDQQPKLFFNANSNLPIAEHDVAEAYEQSQRIELLPPQNRDEVTFAYTDFGPAGELVSQRHIEDLDLWLNQFSNGVRYNFKQTDFQADNVLINVRVGSGRLSQPQDTAGLDYLANYGLLMGGLGQHTTAEITDIMNGRVINLNFGVGFDAFVFSISCAPRELTLALQTLTAILQDSAYRPEGLRVARAGYGSLYERLSSTPGGPIFAVAPRVLTNGDDRFGVPNNVTLYSRTLPELWAWVEPAFKHGPIEISIVGDVEAATADAAVAQTLGALSTRQSRDPDERDDLAIPRTDGKTILTPVSAKLGQSAVAYYWPVPEVKDVHMERRCNLLAALVEERLRKRVREEFGAAYSVTTQFTEIDGFPHQNYFMTYAEVEPSRAHEIDQLIRREIAAMKREGITRDEFERTKQPMIARREVDLRTNSYWGYTVLRDVQQRAGRLASARDRSSDLAAITPSEIQALLDRYFDLSAVFSFRSVPDESVNQVR